MLIHFSHIDSLRPWTRPKLLCPAGSQDRRRSGLPCPQGIFATYRDKPVFFKSPALLGRFFTTNMPPEKPKTVYIISCCQIQKNYGSKFYHHPISTCLGLCTWFCTVILSTKGFFYQFFFCVCHNWILLSSKVFLNIRDDIIRYFLIKHENYYPHFNTILIL